MAPKRRMIERRSGEDPDDVAAMADLSVEALVEVVDPDRVPSFLTPKEKCW
jgi:hypothetical protein